MVETVFERYLEFSRHNGDLLSVRAIKIKIPSEIVAIRFKTYCRTHMIPSVCFLKVSAVLTKVIR